MSRPPRHLADLELAERREAVAELGERTSRADQLSRHYFARYTDSPEDMTDLPVSVRAALTELRDSLPSLGQLKIGEVARWSRHCDSVRAAFRRHSGR